MNQPTSEKLFPLKKSMGIKSWKFTLLRSPLPLVGPLVSNHAGRAKK